MGCTADLYPWVEATIGAGSNGAAQPAGFTNPSTGEGSTAMGFYNVQHGDAPYLKSLADTYSMSDNFHQSVKGGTGANHIMLGTGDAIWFTDGDGKPATPPNNPVNPAGARNAGRRFQQRFERNRKSRIRSRAPTITTRRTATAAAPDSRRRRRRRRTTAAAPMSNCSIQSQPGVAASRELPQGRCPIR